MKGKRKRKMCIYKEKLGMNCMSRSVRVNALGFLQQGECEKNESKKPWQQLFLIFF